MIFRYHRTVSALKRDPVESGNPLAEWRGRENGPIEGLNPHGLTATSQDVEALTATLHRVPQFHLASTAPSRPLHKDLGVPSLHELLDALGHDNAPIFCGDGQSDSGATTRTSTTSPYSSCSSKTTSVCPRAAIMSGVNSRRVPPVPPFTSTG